MKKIKQSMGTSEIEALNIVLIDEFLASGICFFPYTSENKSRLNEYMGSVSEEKMREVNEALGVSVGL